MNTRLLCMVAWLSAVSAQATMGRFPLASNATASYPALADFQVLASAAWERAYAVNLAPTSFVRTETVELGWTNGPPTILTNSVPGTTNTVIVTITNQYLWRETIQITNWAWIHEGVTGSVSSLSRAELAALDREIERLIPYYIDSSVSASNEWDTWFSTPAVSAGVTSYPSAFPAWSVSNVWKAGGIGTTLTRSTIGFGGALTTLAAYAFAWQPDVAVTVVLAQAKVVITNTTLVATTNTVVTNGVTNLTVRFDEHYDLALEGADWLWPFVDGDKTPYENVATNYWTPPRAVITWANTNHAAFEPMLYLAGTIITNPGSGSSWQGSYAEQIAFGSGSTEQHCAQAWLDVTAMTNTWAGRHETNGQWDTLRGTDVSIVWTQRCTLYSGAIGGSTAIRPPPLIRGISRTALDSRARALDALRWTANDRFRRIQTTTRREFATHVPYDTVSNICGAEVCAFDSVATAEVASATMVSMTAQWGWWCTNELCEYPDGGFAYVTHWAASDAYPLTDYWPTNFAAAPACDAYRRIDTVTNYWLDLCLARPASNMAFAAVSTTWTTETSTNGNRAIASAADTSFTVSACDCLTLYDYAYSAYGDGESQCGSTYYPSNTFTMFSDRMTTAGRGNATMYYLILSRWDVPGGFVYVGL